MNTKLWLSTVTHLATMKGAGSTVGAMQHSGSELIQNTDLTVLRDSATQAAHGLAELNIDFANQRLARMVTDITDTLAQLDSQPGSAGRRLTSTADAARAVLGKLT